MPASFGVTPVTLPELLAGLRANTLDFEDTLAFVAAHFHYQPSAFKNGLDDQAVMNAAGQNEGACRVFALGQLQQLSPEDTLSLFGRHFRDVLNDPNGSSHANIRQFMRHGWAGIAFEQAALAPKI